ncbi:MAG: hypothetical protein EOO46_17125 [Flavobacterium sp.]|nr:MAG: hypothetical protein EOO46_17125 [Flavobacterium sp.]
MQPTIKRLLPDTTKGWEAVDEYKRYLSRMELAKSLGLSEIEQSSDSLEVRVWWQASIYSPSSVWVINGQADSLNAKRIDYYPNYTTGQIDSSHVVELRPKFGRWNDYFHSVNFASIWEMPPYYHIGRGRGCVDGETITIEAFDKERYKTVSYPCYTLYRDSSFYNRFTTVAEQLMALREN